MGSKTTVRDYKFFSLYITAIIAVSGIAAHLSPQLLPILLTVYFIWSPWHYTGQNFGISMMMMRRARTPPNQPERNLLYLSYLGSYIVWLVELNGLNTQDAMTLTVEIHDTLSFALKTLGYALFLICSLTSFLSLARRTGFQALVGPLLLHLTQFLWFLLPGLLRQFDNHDLPATYFNAGILALMHCTQYLWVTSYYSKKETQDGLRGDGKQWRPLKYFAILTLGGIALFVPGPWIVSIVFKHDLFESALIFVAVVNIHHFMLDGAIWKLRDGRIARLLLGKVPPKTNAKPKSGANEKPEFAIWILGNSGLARATRYTGICCLLLLAATDQLQYLLTKPGTSKDQIRFALSLNPNDSRAYFRKAENLIANGEHQAATNELQTALDLNPNNMAVLHALAQHRLQSQDIAAAKTLYRRILRLSPNDFSALNNSGLIAIAESNWKEAETLFQKACKIKPSNWKTRAFLGQSLTQQGNYKRAIPILESSLPKLNEINTAKGRERLPIILPSLAQAYEKTGDPDKAAALRILQNTDR